MLMNFFKIKIQEIVKEDEDDNEEYQSESINNSSNSQILNDSQIKKIEKTKLQIKSKKTIALTNKKIFPEKTQKESKNFPEKIQKYIQVKEKQLKKNTINLLNSEFIKTRNKKNSKNLNFDEFIEENIYTYDSPKDSISSSLEKKPSEKKNIIVDSNIPSDIDNSNDSCNETETQEKTMKIKEDLEQDQKLTDIFIKNKQKNKENIKIQKKNFFQNPENPKEKIKDLKKKVKEYSENILTTEKEKIKTKQSINTQLTLNNNSNTNNKILDEKNKYLDSIKNYIKPDNLPFFSEKLEKILIEQKIQVDNLENNQSLFYNANKHTGNFIKNNTLTDRNKIQNQNSIISHKSEAKKNPKIFDYDYLLKIENKPDLFSNKNINIFHQKIKSPINKIKKNEENFSNEKNFKIKENLNFNSINFNKENSNEIKYSIEPKYEDKNKSVLQSEIFSIDKYKDNINKIIKLTNKKIFATKNTERNTIKQFKNLKEEKNLENSNILYTTPNNYQNDKEYNDFSYEKLNLHTINQSSIKKNKESEKIQNENSYFFEKNDLIRVNTKSSCDNLGDYGRNYIFNTCGNIENNNHNICTQESIKDINYCSDVFNIVNKIKIRKISENKNTIKKDERLLRNLFSEDFSLKNISEKNEKIENKKEIIDNLILNTHNSIILTNQDKSRFSPIPINNLTNELNNNIFHKKNSNINKNPEIKTKNSIIPYEKDNFIKENKITEKLSESTVHSLNSIKVLEKTTTIDENKNNNNNNNNNLDLYQKYMEKKIQLENKNLNIEFVYTNKLAENKIPENSKKNNMNDYLKKTTQAGKFCMKIFPPEKIMKTQIKEFYSTAININSIFQGEKIKLYNYLANLISQNNIFLLQLVDKFQCLKNGCNFYIEILNENQMEKTKLSGLEIQENLYYLKFKFVKGNDIIFKEESMSLLKLLNLKYML